tara:strand:- start:3078 stop:4085 length:1008 start_codon:yes stop_codon:yes gene_type:complete
MKKVLITGGAGFIGSQLGYHLHKKGHGVILLDNMSYGNKDNLEIDGETFGTFIEDDVRNKTIFDYTKDVDYIYHFAGIAPLPDCQENPKDAIDINVGGTANVLEAARMNGVKRVIFASTSALYENHKTYPAKENDDIFPDLIYATTKKQCELLCESFGSVYDLPIVMLRFFNVYGPHQDFRRKHPPLTGYLMKTFLQNEIPILFSDGEQRRDYVYIDDLINICEIVMTHDKAVGEKFNVSSGDTYSVNEIYNSVAKCFNVTSTPNYNVPSNFWNAYPHLFKGEYKLNKDRLEKEVLKYCLGDTIKSKKVLGWEAKTELDDGMKKCVEHAKKIGLD